MPTRFEGDDPLRIGDRIDVIETWGDWTDDVIVQRHQCPFNINDAIGILNREANERGPATWILAILEMELAAEDETGMNQPRIPERATAINIRFCPFCGSKLEDLSRAGG